MSKKWPVFLCFIILFTGCSSSNSDEEAYQSTFFAMDTVISLTVYGENAQEVALAAEKEVYRLEGLFSAALADSDVSRINADGSASLNPDTLAVVECALALYNNTKGAFDITVYPLVEAWGFFSGDYAVPEQSYIHELLEITGSDKVSLAGDTMSLDHQGMGIDLGAIGKGYASDMAAQALREEGVSSAIISLGGNIYALGSKPDGSSWTVGIEYPLSDTGIIGTVTVSDMAVVTSSGFQRNFEADGQTYHHILDPETGAPAESGLSSVTIVCESGMLADGLSTALFVMGEAEAITLWRSGIYDFEAVLISTDGQVTITQGLAECYAGTVSNIAER